VLFKHLSFAKTFQNLVIAASFLSTSIGVLAVGQTPAAVSRQLLYRMDLSSGQIVSSTWHGSQLLGATMVESTPGARWLLVGATEIDNSGTHKLVYFDGLSGDVRVSFYGGSRNETFLGSAALAKLGTGWSARAVADIKGDGSLGVIAENQTSGEIAVYFFGGSRSTTLMGRETVSPLSASGWNVVGAADLNGDGRPDLILQNDSTRQVRVTYLGGSNGTTVTAAEDLEGGNFEGWRAAGMQDMNGDGHPDLILTDDATGESAVRYYGGELGVNYLGSDDLDHSGAAGSIIVIPTTSATNTGSAISAETSPLPGNANPVNANVDENKANAGTTPVLIFNGTGTIANDVTAVESLVSSLGLAYHTANSSQLDSMSEAQLTAYKLLIVPGGNSITIGENLSAKASSTVHNAVSSGLNYLGICAGGFFGGFSAYYNGLNLTSGVWFNYYADHSKGINKEAVEISFPNNKPKLDIYWQDGPELSGWGQVVGKYPNGTPAVTQGYWGQGFVILSGVHPEAPASWRYGMVFTTPLDTDLAFAGSLVTAAMNRKPLAHF
jgi:hypothetical protein